jgi:hypothetical protein
MLRALVGAIVLVLVLAGCGASGGTAEPSVATGGSVTTTQAATTQAAITTAGGDEIVPIDAAPCDLLTADEVAAATGLAVEEVRDEPPISCDFRLGPDAGVYIEVIIEDGQGRLGGAANLLSEYLLLVEDGEAEVVADVGEQAVCCPFRTIAVDAGGGRFFAVGVGGGYTELAEPLEVLLSLAKSILDRL